MISHLEESRALRLLLGSLLLAAGLACVAFLVVSLARDLSLWVFGRHVAAVITDRRAVETSEPGSTQKTFAYSVDYEFTTTNGRRIRRTAPVGAREWAGLGMPGGSNVVYQEQQMVPPDWVQDDLENTRLGNLVSVIYFPPYPEHNRLDDIRYIPTYLCLYVPLVVVGWLGLKLGLGVLRSGETLGEGVWSGMRRSGHSAV